MRHIFKKLPDSVVEVEVSLDHQEFLNYYQPIYGQALSSVPLKGFRPGAAPKELAEKAVNKEKVFEEAALKAIRGSLEKISEENNWQLIDQPKVEILETEPAKGIGLKFKATLTIFPEIKLGNYKKIAKEVFSKKAGIIVSEEEIKDAVDWILNSRAKIVRVAREAKMGDVVNIEYKGKTDQFILGHSHIEKDFDAKIVNHKAGEEFDGIKLVSVFERQLPELDDAFVKGLGKFETVDELKKSIKEGIQKEKEIKESEKLRIKALEEIVKDSKIDIPEVMAEKTLAGMMEDYKVYFKGNMKEEELKIKLKPEAEKSVASNLVLYKIAKEEKLEPTAEEIEAESNKFLATLRPDMASKIEPQKIYNYSYDIVKNKKVFEFLENLK